MSGTIEQAQIKNIRKIFQQKWPEYRVIGNYSHDKGVWVLKKEDTPKITQIFDKNFDLQQAMNIEGYHPEKPLEEILDNGKMKSLFGTITPVSNSKAYLRNFLNAFISHYKTAQTLGEVFDICLPDMPINIAQESYKKLK